MVLVVFQSTDQSKTTLNILKLKHCKTLKLYLNGLILNKVYQHDSEVFASAQLKQLDG